jgi:hypothetical protein
VSFECMHKGKPAGKVFLSFLRITTTTAAGMPAKRVPENLRKIVIEERTKDKVSTRGRLCNGGSEGFLIERMDKDLKYV